MKTHHHVKWFDYYLVCETMCSHYKSSEVTIFNSRIRPKCFSAMEAGFFYDCSSGKYPIFSCFLFVNIWLPNISKKKSWKFYGNCVEISNFLLFQFCVFTTFILKSLRVLLQKVGQKVCENIGNVFCGIHSPVSKLKWVYRQNQAILEQKDTLLSQIHECNIMALWFFL